jgi:DNA-binding transcriptional MerR regulator
MAAQTNRKHDDSQPVIPDRLYFKIGDVARLCGVKTYVLRFWESQFPQLKPNKSGTGQRLYRRRDVELALEIKRLVHTEGYTLAGARSILEEGQRRPGPRPAESRQPTVTALASESVRLDAATAAIGHARAELHEIAELLSSPVAPPVRRRARVTTMRPRAASGLFFPA